MDDTHARSLATAAIKRTASKILRDVGWHQDEANPAVFTKDHMKIQMTYPIALALWDVYGLQT